MAQSENRQFKMHPQLIMDTMQRQAGTLDKAILEGVMNGVDAGASSINITLTDSKLIIVDDGRGFRSRKEIDDWFETFGQPHTESEGKTYGRFRMGRGQLFAYGKNLWRAGAFRMSVDINNRGLDYTLETLEQEHEGCRIEIKLYEKLLPSELNEIMDDLKFKAKFVKTQLVLNEKKINISPEEYSWTEETEDADIKLGSGKALCVYNQGIHVMDFPNHKFGVCGEIVSKKPLKVNFARNEIMSDCPVWRRVRAGIQTEATAQNVVRRTRANDDTRKNLCRQLRDNQIAVVAQARTLKFIPKYSDTQGNNTPSCSYNEIVKDYKGRITTVPADGEYYEHDVAQMLRHKLCFVADRKILDWFGCDSLEDVINVFNRTGNSKLKEIDFQKQCDSLNIENYLVPEKEWTVNEKLLMQILNRMLAWLYWPFQHVDDSETVDRRKRKIVVGAGSLLEAAPAWTDGFSFVAINREFISKLPKPTLRAANWGAFARIILHELCHDTPTTKAHTHSKKFYELYHDVRNYNHRADLIGSFVRNCMLEVPYRYSLIKKKMPKSLWAHLDQEAKANHKAEEIDLLEKLQEGGMLPDEE